MPNFPKWKVVATFDSEEDAHRFRTVLESLMNRYLAYVRGALVKIPKLTIEEDREL